MAQGSSDTTHAFPELRTLQEKLRYLMEHYTNAEGKPYTISSLAAAVRAYCPELSTVPTTISNLLNGVTHDPSWRLIEGLAHAFGVKTDLFRDGAPDDSIRIALQELEAMEFFKRGDIRALAARAADYDPEVVQAITELMGIIADKEQLKRQQRLQDET